MTQQPQSFLACFRTLCKTRTDCTALPPTPPTVLPKKTSRYSPISSIPQTSAARLAESALSSTSPDALSEPPIPADPREFAPSPPVDSKTPPRPKTVLYLAYGSNLAAETFLGVRGIRPISQINVAAPSLRLTFDLPGIPYSEPCFANTAIRKIPKIPDKPPKIPDIPDLPHPPWTVNQHGDPEWTSGLIGVVYEVTLADYAHIIETEGAGVAYQDVLIPCAALPPTVRVPEKPPVPELPKPFLAHTLLAPTSLPGDGDGDKEQLDSLIMNHFYPSSDRNDDGDESPPPSIPKWALKFLRPTVRPDPEYAQPSPRYLNLITTGAAEHDLPQDYQEWLQALHPYQRTTFWQTVGQWVVVAFWMPLMGLVMWLSKQVADDKGRIPLWLAVIMGALFKGIWWSYDAMMKPVFGDGERTIEEDDEGAGKGFKAREREAIWDEKRALLT